MGALEPSNNPEYDGYARDGGYSSQEIDSDLEEQVLSHVYYGNRTYADAQKGGHNGMSIRTDSLETAKKSKAFEEDSESRYQEIGKANDRRAISGAQSADDRGEEDNASSDASEPVVFDAGLTVNLDSGDDEINSMDESHESLVGANIPAGTGVNGNASGTLKKLQGPTLFDEDNDYDYLDNAGYMGKNRYYMEDEVINSNKVTAYCYNCGLMGHFGD
ncbi:hypothetical protein EV182_004564, partial [Spiromyces aspiralis]